MQASIDQAHDLSPLDSLQIENGGGHTSVGVFVRQWGPYVFAALLVPGGIAILLLLLLRRRNQKRQAAQSPART